jgi:hypothetical protein
VKIAVEPLLNTFDAVSSQKSTPAAVDAFP